LTWPWALAGAVLLVAGTVPVAAAMGVNRNLETSVRIQTDRGHQVVTTGPYRYVRHPMYVGQVLQLPATALLLGSTWALLPALACLVIMVIRTALEDSVLCRELAGYREYSAVTRYRLVPGIW
jgi:protein-S-isoprenylcysteine O-methyltransferase Ste14